MMMSDKNVDGKSLPHNWRNSQHFTLKLGIILF